MKTYSRVITKIIEQNFIGLQNIVEMSVSKMKNKAPAKVPSI